MVAVVTIQHKCWEGDEPMRGVLWGAGISRIEWWADEHSWVSHCDEYGDRIDFCPFCGLKLEPPTAPKDAV